MTNQTNPNEDQPTIQTELTHFLKTIYYRGKDGEGYSDTQLHTDLKVIEAYGEDKYFSGYKQGVSDEIECVETTGEHASLTNKGE